VASNQVEFILFVGELSVTTGNLLQLFPKVFFGS